VDLKRKLRRLNLWAYLFIIPALTFYSVFTLRPLTQSIILSFYDWDGFNPVKRFVGFANYIEALSDPVLGLALLNNIKWVLISIILSQGTALLLAVLISRCIIGQSFFRSVLFFPNMLSPMIAALIWGRIYDPLIGFVNTFLKSIGYGHLARGWLGSPEWALIAVCIANSWRAYGYYMVLYLAGLQSVDPTLYDAAKVDGANGWQEFWYVTLPSIRPTTTLVLSLALINSLMTFDMVWGMTQGGPFHRSEVLSTLIYKTAFASNRVGYGCALSLMQAILIFTITILFIRIRERSEG
jgi:raffinose/stachyose/melibiose transport system permease protein